MKFHEPQCTGVKPQPAIMLPDLEAAILLLSRISQYLANLKSCCSPASPPSAAPAEETSAPGESTTAPDVEEMPKYSNLSRMVEAMGCCSYWASYPCFGHLTDQLPESHADIKFCPWCGARKDRPTSPDPKPGAEQLPPPPSLQDLSSYEIPGAAIVWEHRVPDFAKALDPDWKSVKLVVHLPRTAEKISAAPDWMDLAPFHHYEVERYTHSDGSLTYLFSR